MVAGACTFLFLFRTAAGMCHMLLYYDRILEYDCTALLVGLICIDRVKLACRPGSRIQRTWESRVVFRFSLPVCLTVSEVGSRSWRAGPLAARLKLAFVCSKRMIRRSGGYGISTRFLIWSCIESFESRWKRMCKPSVSANLKFKSGITQGWCINCMHGNPLSLPRKLIQNFKSDNRVEVCKIALTAVIIQRDWLGLACGFVSLRAEHFLGQKGKQNRVFVDCHHAPACPKSSAQSNTLHSEIFSSSGKQKDLTEKHNYRKASWTRIHEQATLH